MTKVLSRVLPILVSAGVLHAQPSGIPNNVDDITKLTELAAKYGPFAFALIFLAATGWLIPYAKKTNGNAVWLFPAATLASCIFFSFMGVHHWTEIERAAQVFEGQILEVSSYEDLFPAVPTDEVYLKTIPGQKVQDEVVEPPHTVAFAIIKKTPFAPGDQIKIEYKKRDQEKRRTLTIPYDTGDTPQYKIDYDETHDTYALSNTKGAPVKADRRGGPIPSPFAAYAQAQQTPRAIRPGIQAQAIPSKPVVDLRLVELLQDPRTAVGAKIDAIDHLRAMNAPTQRAYAETVEGGESFALTLIELSRHSDKELSYKAGLVVKSSGAESVLAQKLASPIRQEQVAAKQAVLRVSQDRAEAILKQAPVTAQTKALSAQVQSGAAQQVLVPVGSAEGDRYYVAAKWNPTDIKTKRCLTELFNRELSSNRSVQDEEKLMEGRGERIAYWYSKEWALSMADKISKCGATASFPNPTRKSVAASAR